MLSITNRSQWPDWFVKPVALWIRDRAGIAINYNLILPSYSKMHVFCGRGWSYKSRCRIHRRFTPTLGWPYTDKYWRYAWSFTHQLENRLEAFVHLVAHEMFHATGGSRAKWGSDVQGMEMACQRFGRDTVLEFRKAWPAMKAKCKQKMRDSRQRQVKKKQAKSDPSMKFLDAQAAFERWNKKAKLAATKMKKYRRRMNYYSTRAAAAGTKV